MARKGCGNMWRWYDVNLVDRMSSYTRHRYPLYQVQCRVLLDTLFHNVFYVGFPQPPIITNRSSARSKARICSRSLAGIACSNPASAMDVCVL